MAYAKPALGPGLHGGQDHWALPSCSLYHACDPRQRDLRRARGLPRPRLTPHSLSCGVSGPGPLWRDATATAGDELFLFIDISQYGEQCFISLLPIILYAKKILSMPILGSLPI